MKFLVRWLLCKGVSVCYFTRACMHTDTRGISYRPALYATRICKGGGVCQAR